MIHLFEKWNNKPKRCGVKKSQNFTFANFGVIKRRAPDRSCHRNHNMFVEGKVSNSSKKVVRFLGNMSVAFPFWPSKIKQRNSSSSVSTNGSPKTYSMYISRWNPPSNERTSSSSSGEVEEEEDDDEHEDYQEEEEEKKGRGANFHSSWLASV